MVSVALMFVREPPAHDGQYAAAVVLHSHMRCIEKQSAEHTLSVRFS